MGTKIKYENKDLHLFLSGVEFSVDVKATADYWYQPCVMYFKDGSGQPEDEGWEVEDIKATWSLNNGIVEPTDGMQRALEEYIADLDLSEWIFPEEPEYDEPEDC